MFSKGKIFSFGKESIFLFQKNHPLLEDRKSKLVLWISLVFRASTNIFLMTTIIFWNFSSKVLKIYHQNVFNSENLLSSIDQCTENFIQTFKTRWKVITVLLLHLKEITWKGTVYIFSFYSFFYSLLFFLLLLLLLLI